MQAYKFLRILFAVAFAAAAAPSSAIVLTLSHSDGEFVDRGTIGATVVTGDSLRLDCAAGLAQARNGNQIVLTARRLPGTYVPGSGECFTVGVDLGTLAAGTYDIEARLYSVDGSAYETSRQSLTVLPLEGRCNADPKLVPMLLVLHKTMTPQQIAEKVASDPAYAERLGYPVVEAGVNIGLKFYAYFTYPPLVDPTVMSVRVHETGEFQDVSRNGWLCGVPPPSPSARFVEFYNAGLDHYFYSGDASEIAAIDAGKVGAWTRTGKSFTATTDVPGCLRSNVDVVYRFYGIPGKGPNSHFFTRDRAECSKVDRSGQWTFEGLPFYALAPASDGLCPGMGALYRVWRPFGDSNHRFTTDRAVVSEMVAKGWIDEGAAMCVLPGS